MFAAVLLAACGAAADAGGEVTAPASNNTTTPYAIDAPATAPNRPATYKDLPLQLVTRPTPTITPVNGVIGVVCVGMSNAVQECNRLITNTNPGGAWASEKSNAVRIVNCSLGAHAIERWIDPAFDSALWTDCVQRQLPARNLRVEQVRVILHKAANQFGIGSNGSALPAYPSPQANYWTFQSNLTNFAGRVRGFFPAVQAVYTSTRVYGGWAAREDRSEPRSYEEGHALNRWLATRPTVDGVWYGWWGYIWAPECGASMRNGAGVCYDRADFATDGVHPSAAGETKIARMQHDRLRQDGWYRP